MEVSKKIVIAGHFGVGKTSLIKRFVHQKFSDQYLTTIGVKIDKKIIEAKGVKMNLILWDIAGEKSAAKIPKSYFMGMHGLMYVFDLTRPETYQHIADDIAEITMGNMNIETTILGNKKDLAKDDFLKDLKVQLPVNFKATSALSGENVEEAFQSLAENLL